ncbi:zinc-binding metallopeptidase family protein [Pseudoroseicyclus aestuarii]|uniref:Zinc-ribbon domain-containing protein n=1 Tax=Pseudoroseicyclus aestuarii TaxID=1795041 RepID=A0A318TB70_9RHOB|nr:putative zinc-binding peptidase [Pseudoroseicyclus aestuarii]PYE85568.1 hypothetical protein DFP88_101236 [Pseudoroseicyclus aestuarii]
MKLFHCPHCGQTLYFENESCLNCSRTVGYSPDLGTMTSLRPEGPRWIADADPDPSARYRFCANWEQGACNWLIPAPETAPVKEGALCTACRHNRMIPDLSAPEAKARWIRIETAKRRLIYTLLRLGLPLPLAGTGHPEPLIFDFLSQEGSAEPVMTGHASGVVTIALEEADDAEREKRRIGMGEDYRTLLGHFRHEIGHYYWDLLVRDGGHLEACRARFGDDREDYQGALNRHYENGPPADWAERHVSPYASMHPWEDWAETWAHYLHIVDTLEMAGSLGLTIYSAVGAPDEAVIAGQVDFDPMRLQEVAPLMRAWVPVSTALNALNRAMGQADIYPFVLPEPAVEKIGFVQRLVQEARDQGSRGSSGS